CCCRSGEGGQETRRGGDRNGHRRRGTGTKIPGIGKRRPALSPFGRLEYRRHPATGCNGRTRAEDRPIGSSGESGPASIMNPVPQAAVALDGSTLSEFCSPYHRLSVDEWSLLRADSPLTRPVDEVGRLRSLDDSIDRNGV